MVPLYLNPAAENLIKFMSEFGINQDWVYLNLPPFLTELLGRSTTPPLRMSGQESSGGNQQAPQQQEE
eukprot:5291342-Prorocentrum_lima.AAC.1